jgi:hypothetical protein
MSEAEEAKDPDLKDLLPYGFAIHHGIHIFSNSNSNLTQIRYTHTVSLCLSVSHFLYRVMTLNLHILLM